MNVMQLIIREYSEERFFFSWIQYKIKLNRIQVYSNKIMNQKVVKPVVTLMRSFFTNKQQKNSNQQANGIEINTKQSKHYVQKDKEDAIRLSSQRGSFQKSVENTVETIKQSLFGKKINLIPIQQNREIENIVPYQDVTFSDQNEIQNNRSGPGNEFLLASTSQSPRRQQSKTLREVLLEKMQRLEHRYNKAERMRGFIQKLEPIATKREDELKVKKNRMKMTETIQFIQQKKVEQESPIPASTEWRQENVSNQKKSIKQIQNMSPSSPTKSRNNSSPKLEKINRSKSKQIKKESPPKATSRPKMQTLITLERPMPYSIYNLYQRAPEYVTLCSLSNP